MRSKNFIIFLIIGLLLTPIISFAGKTPITTETNLKTPDSDMGVIPGETYYYWIDHLTIPENQLPENISISDLSNNKLYVKVANIKELSAEGTDVKRVDYLSGLILENEITVDIGEGIEAISMVLPVGSATPATMLSGTPFFNVSGLPMELGYLYPEIYFINLDFTDHETYFQNMGFDVTSTSEYLNVQKTGVSSEITMEWQKSTGRLTYLRIENDDFWGYNYTEGLLELTYHSMEFNDLGLNVGDEILMHADTANLDIDGSGDMYTLMESYITEPEETISNMEGNDLIKYTINDVDGICYNATPYLYDTTTQSLVKYSSLYMIGFYSLGTTIFEMSPMSTFTMEPFFGHSQEITQTYNTLFLLLMMKPAITPDWDIYAGQMLLFDTILNTYVDDLLDLIEESSQIGLDTIGGSLTLGEDDGYRFIQEEINLEMTTDLSALIYDEASRLETSITADISLNSRSWISYSSTGILSGMRTINDIDIEASSSVAQQSTEIPTGIVNMDLEMKLMNPEYDSPDAFEGSGIIPGFTWLIAIPAIFFVSTIYIIYRKKS
ncbi:MAG: hypothetical protein U9O98_02585 [Asgard group archaeon]|nr:hypothetical protein [Asgard group archaeon]